MSLRLSIDLNSATLGDLEALVAAAHTVGAASNSAVILDTADATLSLQTDPDARATPAAQQVRQPGAASASSDGEQSSHPWSGAITSGVGEAAVRSVIDILTGRQEPPERQG